MKILILRFSSIGDIVLTTPVIRCLKEQVPEVEIHYATKLSYASILSANPYVDKIHTLDNDINELISELQNEQFDLVIDLHRNVRTQIIKMRLRVKSYVVNKLNFEKWLLTQFKIDKLPKYNHIVDRYMYTTKRLGVKYDNKGLDYFIPFDEEVAIHERYKIKKPFIAVAIGAKFATKRLPYQQLKLIIDQLDYPVILLGGIDDMVRGEELANNSLNKQVVNTAGKLSLHESASIVQQAVLLITHDTGLMHIGAAFQKNMVTIWGNTVPELGMYPHLDKSKYTIIQVDDLSCRPCSKIGYKKCPKEHFSCMQQIDINEVVQAVNYYLTPVE